MVDYSKIKRDENYGHLCIQFLLYNYEEEIKNSNLSQECKDDLLFHLNFCKENEIADAYYNLEEFAGRLLKFVLFPQYQTERDYYEMMCEFHINHETSKEYLDTYGFRDIDEEYKKSKEHCKLVDTVRFDIKDLVAELPEKRPEWFTYKFFMDDFAWILLCKSVCVDKNLLEEFDSGSIPKYEDVIRDYC